jgi:hypothetical protein
LVTIGIEQGKIKGMIEGKIKGKIKAAQEILLDILAGRFNSVPEDISEEIKHIDKINLLKSLVPQAVTCSDMKDFRKLLQ